VWRARLPRRRKSALGSRIATMKRGTIGALVLAVAACATPPPPPVYVPPPVPSPVAAPLSLSDLKIGPIVLTVSDARTAQVFHVVDELAKPVAPQGAYGEWASKALPLDETERAMLAAHAKLRARRGVGALDQAFYAALTIREAVQHAVEKKLLTQADAEAEGALLEHFAPRLDPLLEAQGATLHAFEVDVAEASRRAAPLAAQLGRFCETTDTVEVHAFVVADPSATHGESAWRGGALVVEAMPDYDNVPTFLHALFDVIFARRRGSFAIASEKCDESIDPETMEEGVAYAFAPGLVHPAGRDLLLEMVNEDAARTLRSPEVRYERLALALRTELGSALESGHDTLSSFLPKECDAWAKITAR